MKIYFAHPHDSVGTPLEKVLLEEMAGRGWEVINPFENNPAEEIMDRIIHGTFDVCDALLLVETDLDSIDECEAVLVWIPDNSNALGTICELVYAFKAHKYVTVIHQRDNGSVHPWVVYHASCMYKTVDAFIAGINVDNYVL